MAIVTRQTNVRLNKTDIKNIDAIKILMHKANIPENLVTKSSAIQWALAQTAKNWSAK
jgi:hypothetical protein